MNFKTWVLFHLLTIIDRLELFDWGYFQYNEIVDLVCYFSYGWYLAFVQGFVYLFLICLQGFARKQTEMNQWKTYVKLSAVPMVPMHRGSLAFLDYTNLKSMKVS